jgi:hypothetical protein
MSPDIEKLLKIIERKLDWGESDKWQSKDFENLNELILNETGVSLSASTLRRIWGHVEYKHLPSTTTLDALAKFAGSENWRKFTKENIFTGNPNPTMEAQHIRQPARSRNLIKIISIAIAVIATSLLGIFAVKKTKRPINANDYSLTCQRVTREIPNSVIFTYDATASPTDSVYIQQSWDPSRKTMVDKSLHKHTSVYYEPGFHRAKLIIGDSIVKEQKLLIPTNGWMGMIDRKPVPVYLKSNEFMENNFLEVPVSVIQKKNIALDPQPPFIKYYNVGNFDPVSVKDFSFNAQIKNEHGEGASACQFSFIILVTDDGPIIIPLSVKGCVSEINVMAVDSMVSGKKADLSGFGVDFSNWVNVSCKTTSTQLQFFINEKNALELPLPKKEAQIVGMSYVFQGTGAVKNINLSSNSKLIFHAF